MDPAMIPARPLRVVVLAATLIAGGLLPLLAAVPGAAAGPALYPPLTGTVTGPNALGFNGSHVYFINGTGGPAYLSDGTLVGTLSWYASVSGLNTTGVTVSPASGVLSGTGPGQVTLSASALPQVITLRVELSSVYNGANVSTNLTESVTVLQPYVVAATIVAASGANVFAFSVAVDLDGAPVGTAQVPALSANGTYHLKFDYATLGLSSGDHTFTISLAAEHGLVHFANGATQFSQTFYVPGPAPNYSLWYVTGAVAFFGVLFILATRVAARRRGANRR